MSDYYYFSNVGTPEKKYKPRMKGRKLANRQAQILPIGVAEKSNKGLPLQLTGCVSELSGRPMIYQRYVSALKNYTDAYRRSHSYLGIDDAVADHDYALTVVATEEHELLGVLGDEIEQSIRTHMHFSDEEIEQCGYLGWLQH